jgi:hypothetical protein
MLPAVQDQVTDVFVVPFTVATNCWELPGWSELLAGDTETETGRAAELLGA